MHSIFAIAKVTLKDALRKKVLFTILFFAVLLTVASGFLPSVTASDRMRQAIKVCLAGIGFFGMVVAIFLSAPSLPDDISKKTIFTVMTKPARRWQIIAGKILGLGFVLAILLGVMGAIAYIYIHAWAWKLGADPSGVARLQGNRAVYADTIELNELELKVSEPMLDSQRVVATGLERITFHFTGLDRHRYAGDTVFARVVLFSHGWRYDPKTSEGTAALEVTNPSTGETKRTVFGAETLQPSRLGFPRSMIDKNGRLDITVAKNLRIGSYSAMVSSVSVLSQPGSFTGNFLKALALMFMQYMVLVFIAVAASTVLTSTVSIIFALFVYFTGSLTEVLRAQALSLGTAVNIFTMAQHTHGPQHEHKMTALQWAVNMILRYFYLGISVLFPNLRAYDPSTQISQNEFISLHTIWNGVWYGAVYAAMAFLLAWIIFRRKEVT